MPGYEPFLLCDFHVHTRWSDGRLSVAENLRVYGHLYGVPKLERRIDSLGLRGVARLCGAASQEHLSEVLRRSDDQATATRKEIETQQHKIAAFYPPIRHGIA